MADATFMEEFKRRIGSDDEGGRKTEEASQPVAPEAPAKNFMEEFKSRIQLDGQNAPPTEITAIPQMGMQSLYGRKDLQGNPVEIDESQGIPVGEYWNIAFQSDPQSRADALKKMYPDRKVRILDTGDVTLEVTDQVTGNLKDVVINPKGITKEDFIDLAANTPEIAGGMAAALATGGAGFLRTLGQVFASAAFSAQAGAVKDVEARRAAGIDVRPEDIARDRAAQFMLDLAGQAIFGTVGKASRILSPFATSAEPGTLAFNLKRGMEFLKNNYDMDFATTPAMRTGSSALAAIESAEGPMPGSRSVIDKLRRTRAKQIQEVQDLALGNVPRAEQVGEQAVGELADKIVAPLDSALREAQVQAIKKGDNRILDLLDEALGVPRGASAISAESAGDVTKASFERRLIRAQTAVDEAYAKVNELPGGSGDVLSGDAAAKAASEIRKELPSVLKQVEKETVLVDEASNPITKSVTERKELPSGIPDGLEQALADLEALKGGKVSLQTLTNLKKSAYDAISAFRNAHPDATDRWFSKIASAYETGIQKGIDATENLELKNALAQARDTYKREMVPLERPGLRELAKGEFDTGQLSPEQITDRLFEGPRAWKNYTMLKEVLGADNVALRAVKRAWLDTKLGKATVPVLNTIDTKALSQTFKNMQADHPELFKELLGENYDKLQTVLTARGMMEKLDNVDGNLFRALLNIKDPTVSDLQSLVRMSVVRDRAYVNGILKDISDGLPLDDLRPTEFVRRIRNADMPTEQVETILNKLDPQTRQGIATVEMYRILSEATLKEGSTASQMLRGGRGNISATGILKAVGEGDKRERTLLLLGPDLQAPYGKVSDGAPPVLKKGAQFNREQTLAALVDLTAPAEAARTAFDPAGGLGAGMATRQLLRGPLKYATTFTKNMIAALAYTRGFGRLITNTEFGPEASAVVANTMIASEPFLRASIEAFGPDATRQMVAEAKNVIDKYVMEFNNSPAGRRRAATRQFMQGQQVPMKMEAR